MKKFIILCLKSFLFACSILLLFIFVSAILQGNYGASIVVFLLAIIPSLCLLKLNKHINSRMTKQDDSRMTKQDDSRMTKQDDSRITKQDDSRITKQDDEHIKAINFEIKNNVHFDKEYLETTLGNGKTIKQQMQEDFDNAIKRMNGMDEQKEIELNELEKHFINELLSTLKLFGLDDPIRYERMSNKSINIRYKDMQIGRIKLNGRKMWIQVLFDEENNWDVQYYDVYTLEDATTHIDEWVNYLNSIIRD